MKEFRFTLAASNAIYSRNLNEVFHVADGVRTLTLGEADHVAIHAFAEAKKLRSVRMEDDPGMARAKTRYSSRIGSLFGVFQKSGVQRVWLPRSVYLLG